VAEVAGVVAAGAVKPYVTRSTLKTRTVKVVLQALMSGVAPAATDVSW
jgi:hypothetical protein